MGKQRQKKERHEGGREIKPKFMEERRHRAEPIVAKTPMQKTYLQVLRTEKLIVANGPAGCGKTFLAAALAADALIRKDIEKIVIARPNVAMGMSIGFRQGSDWDKLYPFIRPMLDTIQKRMGKGAYEVALGNKSIELQALDAIRGRSFDGSVVVIVDEVQNAEPSEVQSIVTRMGEGSQMVLCGDPDQNDLRGDNGMDYICRIIEKYSIPDVAVVNFTEDDIVRSSIAKDFVVAFRKERT